MAFVIILFLGVAGAAMLSRPLDAGERLFFGWGFAACVAAAIAQVLVTTYFFGGGDQNTYFRHAQQLTHRISLNFSGYFPEVVKLALRDSTSRVSLSGVAPGSPTGAMNGLTTLVVFLAGESIYATCLFFAILSFFGKAAFYFGLRLHAPKQSRRSILIACFAIPSVVFWTSGILKESVAVTGLGIAVLGAAMLADQRARGAPLFLLGSLVAFLTKPYVVAALMVTLPAWYFVTRAKARNREVRMRHLALAAAVAAAGAILVGEFIPDFAIDRLAGAIDDMQRVGQRVEGGTNYSLGAGGSNLAEQLALAPLGLLASLFRPLPFEISNAMVLASSAEATTLGLWFLLAVVRVGPRQTLSILTRDELLFAAAAFVFVFGTAVGLASTNLGSLSRYRVPMMPFWALIVLELRRRSVARPIPRQSEERSSSRSSPRNHPSTLSAAAKASTLAPARAYGPL